MFSDDPMFKYYKPGLQPETERALKAKEIEDSLRYWTEQVPRNIEAGISSPFLIPIRKEIIQHLIKDKVRYPKQPGDMDLIDREEKKIRKLRSYNAHKMP